MWGGVGRRLQPWDRCLRLRIADDSGGDDFAINRRPPEQQDDADASRTTGLVSCQSLLLGVDAAVVGGPPRPNNADFTAAAIASGS